MANVRRAFFFRRNMIFTSRPQFSLKAALIAVAVLSVVCGMVKFEHDAQATFSVTVTVVKEALQRVEAGADEELYQRWLRDVKSNPTYAANEWSSHMVDGNGGSADGAENGYFGSSTYWSCVRTLPSSNADFSRLPLEPSDTHIDVQVFCSRPWSVLSRQTSIQIIEHAAPDNSLFIDRLKDELGKAGMQFDVIMQF